MLRLSELVSHTLARFELVPSGSDFYINLHLQNGTMYRLGIDVIGELSLDREGESGMGFRSLVFPRDLAERLNRLVAGKLGDSALVIEYIAETYRHLLEGRRARASVSASSSSSGSRASERPGRGAPSRASKRRRGSGSTVSAGKRRKKALSAEPLTSEEMAVLLEKGFTNSGINIILERGFLPENIRSILSQRGGSMSLITLQFLVCNKEAWDRLVDLGINVENIVTVLLYNGGSKNLNALKELVDNKAVWDRLAELGITVDDIIATLSHDGGSNSLDALQRLLCDEARWNRLVELGINTKYIVAILSQNGGPGNLAALQQLADNKSTWNALVRLGIAAKDIVEILSHAGGVKNMQALVTWLITPRFTVLDGYMDKPAQIVLIVHFLKANSRGNKLLCFLDQVSALEKTYVLTEAKIRELAIFCKKHASDKLSKITTIDIAKEVGLTSLLLPPRSAGSVVEMMGGIGFFPPTVEETVARSGTTSLDSKEVSASYDGHDDGLPRAFGLPA